MLIIYLAHPYSALTLEGVEANVANAEKVGRAMIEKGYGIYIPGKATLHMDLMTESYDEIPCSYFYELGLEMMSRCDILLLCPGWEDSRGCRLELKYWRNKYSKDRVFRALDDDIPDPSAFGYGGKTHGKVSDINGKLVFIEIS